MVLAIQTQAERERALAAEELAAIRETGNAMAAQLSRVAEEFLGAMSELTEQLRPVLPPSTLGQPVPQTALALPAAGVMLRHERGLTQLSERVDQGVRMAKTAVLEARAMANRIAAAEEAAKAEKTGGKDGMVRLEEARLQAQLREAHARELEADARLHHAAASESFERRLQLMVAEQVRAALASERVLEARRRGMSRSHNWQART
eukprot:COSAG05_NODE_6130_length_1017_cov_1.299564_1_plen_205_part_10